MCLHLGPMLFEAGWTFGCFASNSWHLTETGVTPLDHWMGVHPNSELGLRARVLLSTPINNSQPIVLLGVFLALSFLQGTGSRDLFLNGDDYSGANPLDASVQPSSSRMQVPWGWRANLACELWFV